MNVYEIKSMAERLDGNTYPGRGIVLGVTPDGKKAVYIEEGDSPEILQRRVMEQAEWILLPQAAELVAAELAAKKA